MDTQNVRKGSGGDAERYKWVRGGGPERLLGVERADVVNLRGEEEKPTGKCKCRENRIVQLLAGSCGGQTQHSYSGDGGTAETNWGIISNEVRRTFRGTLPYLRRTPRMTRGRCAENCTRPERKVPSHGLLDREMGKSESSQPTGRRAASVTSSWDHYRESTVHESVCHMPPLTYLHQVSVTLPTASNT